jgi:hypothetical protein
MKRLSTLPLALTALGLTAGCGGGPAPAPSLTSTDRNERLAAVRSVHGRYGATPPAPAVAPAEDVAAIVGRWDHPLVAAAYFRFNADGTFQRAGLLVSTEGGYRVLPGGVIEFNYPGAFYGRNVVEYRYRLTGEALELYEFDSWIKYTRAK